MPKMGHGLQDSWAASVHDLFDPDDDARPESFVAGDILADLQNTSLALNVGYLDDEGMIAARDVVSDATVEADHVLDDGSSYVEVVAVSARVETRTQGAAAVATTSTCIDVPGELANFATAESSRGLSRDVDTLPAAVARDANVGEGCSVRQMLWVCQVTVSMSPRDETSSSCHSVSELAVHIGGSGCWSEDKTRVAAASIYR